MDVTCIEEIYVKNFHIVVHGWLNDSRFFRGVEYVQAGVTFMIKYFLLRGNFYGNMLLGFIFVWRLTVALMMRGVVLWENGLLICRHSISQPRVWSRRHILILIQGSEFRILVPVCYLKRRYQILLRIYHLFLSVIFRSISILWTMSMLSLIWILLSKNLITSASMPNNVLYLMLIVVYILLFGWFLLIWRSLQSLTLVFLWLSEDFIWMGIFIFIFIVMVLKHDAFVEAHRIS